VIRISITPAAYAAICSAASGHLTCAPIAE
jgi:hypothetical protein